MSEQACIRLTRIQEYPPLWFITVHLIQDKATASTVDQTPGVHHPRLQCIMSIPATEDVHRVAVNHSLLWRSMQLAGFPCPFQTVEFRGQSWGLFDPKKDDPGTGVPLDMLC